MTTNINISNSPNFQLVLPLLPFETSISNLDTLNLNIISTTLPSVSLTETTLHWMGSEVHQEGGINFDDWSITFLIDDNWTNYNILLNWIFNINNGISRFARPFNEYQVTSKLLIYDNYENIINEFEFSRLWPFSLSDVDLSYQQGEENLTCSCTFKYDYFININSNK